MGHTSVWIALAACLLGCYFAACHIALKTFSRSRLTELLEDRGREGWFEPFAQRRPRLMLLTGAIRACLNLVVLLAMLNYFERAYPKWGVVLWYTSAFLTTGVMISVFVVAVPISVARYHRESLLARSIPLLNACLVLLWPVTAFLQVFDPLVRRVLGDGNRDRGDSQLSDEILSVVEQHDDAGSVDEGQKEMLEAVVEFPTTTAGQIMTPRTDVRGIEINATLDEIRAAIHHDGHSRIPIYEKSLDHIVGILYAKDLIAFLGNNKPFEFRKTLRHALMVPESKPVDDLLAEFKARKVHIAIVLDEYGGTAGLVTIEDIIEEIVGEIHDEYEPSEETPHIRRLNDRAVEVDARVYIDDLNDELDLDLPEDKDYDTVGGFVFATLGHIPAQGERFQHENAWFTVTAAERTKVTRVRIDLESPQDSAQDQPDAPKSQRA